MPRTRPALGKQAIRDHEAARARRLAAALKTRYLNMGVGRRATVERIEGRVADSDMILFRRPPGPRKTD
jgi:hypothetical protein